MEHSDISKNLNEQNKFKNEDIPYPDFWGGYLIKPISIEFWQGRSSRMHDRILYKKNSVPFSKIMLKIKVNK